MKTSRVNLVIGTLLLVVFLSLLFLFQVRQTEVAGLSHSYAFPPPQAGCRIGITEITLEVASGGAVGAPRGSRKALLEGSKSPLTSALS